MARISVVCITIRPGVFRFLRETLEAQTFKDFELVVVDGIYEKRHLEVAEYMKGFPFPFKHIPEGKRTKRYALAQADNVGIKESSGELVVWLQDFILIPPDGLQKYWDLYQAHPDAMYTGVDGRISVLPDGPVDLENPTDILMGGTWKRGRLDYVNQRGFDKEIRQSYDAFEFELNWAAFARTVAEDIGGFNEEFDHGFAYDNTEFAFRALTIGKEMWLDPTNYAEALNHWELFPAADDPFVPEREQAVQENNLRYKAYVEAVKLGQAPIYMNYL